MHTFTSRAIGDLTYKQNKKLSAKEQMITALPEIKSIDLCEEDEFVVVACDGVWNVLDSQEVVDFVSKRLGSYTIAKICEDLCDR